LRVLPLHPSFAVVSVNPRFMSLRNIKVVVFDLGGVLLQLNDPIETFGLDMSESEFLECWLRSPSVREFERGATDSETFARAVVEELKLVMRWQDFLKRFNAWPDRIFPETTALLDAIPAGVGRVLLSNTNAAHWGRDGISSALAGRLDRTFLSFDTGLLKPDREAFDQVISAYGMSAERFLFFDDNPLNVSAAIDAGMKAVLCKGPADALRVLRQL
jgi:putative hydrolase of the HAD superfamily